MLPKELKKQIDESLYNNRHLSRDLNIAIEEAVNKLYPIIETYYDSLIPKWVDIDDANLTNGEMYLFKSDDEIKYLMYDKGLLRNQHGLIIYKFKFEAKKVLIGLPTPPKN